MGLGGRGGGYNDGPFNNTVYEIWVTKVLNEDREPDLKEKPFMT